MVGTNGKVGQNPRLVSIEYTFKWDGWNAQFKKRQTLANISYIVIQYINDLIRSFPRSSYKYPLKPGQGPRNRGGNGNMCPPLFKSEKSALLGAKVPHLQNEKSTSWIDALFCWKESALFSVVKKTIFVRLVNDIKSFDFGHIQKYPFWPMPLHFRNASAASEILQVLYW
jgi:hypothetical protein